VIPETIKKLYFPLIYIQVKLNVEQSGNGAEIFVMLLSQISDETQTTVTKVVHDFLHSLQPGAEVAPLVKP
jgi:hypothetical protein